MLGRKVMPNEEKVEYIVIGIAIGIAIGFVLKAIIDTYDLVWSLPIW